MKTKNLIQILVIASLVISSSACVKPASQAPTATPTVAAGGFPLPGTSNDVMSQLSSFATQTAIAMLGPASIQATGVPAITIVSTEVPAVVTDTLQTTPQAPTATEKIVVPTITPGLPDTYTLKKGEHPYCIARRFNVNPEEMLRLSGLGGGGTYSTGTVLKIPQSGKFPGKRALRPHPVTYTVQSGDTLYTIACDFGDADPNLIVIANKLKPPFKLEAGQKLYIP